MAVARTLLSLVVVWAWTVSVSADPERLYPDEIKPVLRARCYACHGALKQKADLRLDTARQIKAAGILKSGKLLDRLTAQDPDQRMPPEGEPLEAEQIANIRKWIESGAAIPASETAEDDPRKHWSFQRIERPQLPNTRFANPIDALLASAHKRHALTPQPQAPRLILLRRLYLDLVGIPPTAEDIAAFENDKSPQRYERLVQRLLEDPRYGERWGRHWMDVWRYSDWWGLGQQLRNSQKHIWHWRDWIIESLNDDMPYDEMVRLMLAGDELHPTDLDRLRATGYLARNWFLFNRHQWMEEVVEHVGKGFLGLTFNCAKCHDHKFDPIRHEDFYRMRAFFEPYHVRTDILPGEADTVRNGIPRVFDGLLDTPTYRFVRGNEKNPDKSQVMTPGVPAVLAFRKLQIQPVTLPADAWQPERRPWILEAHLATAAKNSESAQAALTKAQNQLLAAQKNLKTIRQTPHPQPGKPVTGKPQQLLVHETFETLDTKRWKVFGGQWVHQPGQVEQKRDGAQRAALRLQLPPPRNFEATLRFAILGGSKWRSVGLSFDTTQPDPTQPFTATQTEQQVYVSAVAGGSKVHAAYSKGGQFHYPAGGMRQLPVELGKEHVFRIQVRDTLINAYLNDALVVAWHTPLARRDGAFQITTFDVLPVFKEFKLKALDPAVQLTEPSQKPTQKPLTEQAAKTAVEKAAGSVKLAELDLGIARQARQSLQKRGAALRALWNKDSADVQQKQHEQAIRSQQRLALLKAQRTRTDAETRLVSAATNKKAAIEKEIRTASAAIQKAEKKLAAPVDPQEAITAFAGAKWSATRFMESRTDDPQVKFPTQSTGRRTALANWITHRDNPLAARVAVNHIWQRHMGKPLVPTMFDFGRNGTKPVHPELLDWLAVELMEHGWSMKHLHRVIVTSAAYRMSSSAAGGAASAAKDPENLFWWRREPIRLQSQVVRDSILSFAGTLDATIGGPPVPRAQQAASKRRSLYFFHSNNERNLFLTTFDEAVVTDCYRREESIVPQQALALTNSNLVIDAAQQIAQRLSMGASDEPAFINKAFSVLLGITPGEPEVTASRQALQEWRRLPNGSDKDARTQLVWTLINHNDFVTLR